jgi:hypothetical protein
MYLYVETWKAKPAWHQLSADERVAFASKVGALLESLISPDLAIHGCIINEGEVARKADHLYVAIWEATDPLQIKRIEDGTESIGWHDYFEQVNFGSEAVSPQAVVAHMIAL